MRSVCLPPRACCRRAASPMSRHQRSEIREDLAKRFTDEGTVGTFVGYKVDDYLIIASDKDAVGRGEAAGLDLQDSEFADRAGDRRGRRSRQGCLQMGRRDAQHRGLEQGSHPALGDRGFRGAGLSGDRAAHRRGADAEICRPVRIRQPRYRRRHRPVLADRQSCASIRCSRSISSTGCGAACCRSQSAARSWCAISCR